MAQVAIREYHDQARSVRGLSASTTLGGLVSDELRYPIFVVTTNPTTQVTSPAFSGRTHFVAIEAIGANVRYVVWPEWAKAALNYTQSKQYYKGEAAVWNGDLYYSNSVVPAGSADPTNAPAFWTKFLVTAFHTQVLSGTSAMEQVWPGARIVIKEY